MDARAPSVPESKQALRLWLRLLTCANMIEQRVRARMRAEFATTLPRFDMLSALDRAPGGLTMGELSRRLLVSGGNVTAVSTRLEAEGLIRRIPSPADRRAHIVTLTAKGRSTFATLARHHEQWINGMLAGLGDDEIESMLVLLGRTKDTLDDNSGTGERQ